MSRTYYYSPHEIEDLRMRAIYAAWDAQEILVGANTVPVREPHHLVAWLEQRRIIQRHQACQLRVTPELRKLGLTRDAIRKYVVEIKPHVGAENPKMVDVYAARRAANVSKGLRCDGKPRKLKRYQDRPELVGLIGNEYQRAYMKLWRAGRKQKEVQNTAKI